ncbi:hypothetical protein, partial [Lactococcus lactis]|uniref:hypothetical protein n=1 Tax=Lactococcus lactis TaxID=1358 RepID=UPI003D0A7951
ILWLYSLLADTAYEWFIETYMTMVDLFPIGNTLIVFLFHETFRRNLIASFRKTKNRSHA